MTLTLPQVSAAPCGKCLSPDARPFRAFSVQPLFLGRCEKRARVRKTGCAIIDLATHSARRLIARHKLVSQHKNIPCSLLLLISEPVPQRTASLRLVGFLRTAVGIDLERVLPESRPEAALNLARACARSPSERNPLIQSHWSPHVDIRLPSC